MASCKEGFLYFLWGGIKSSPASQSSAVYFCESLPKLDKKNIATIFQNSSEKSTGRTMPPCMVSQHHNLYTEFGRKKEFEENWTFWPFRSTQRPKRSKSNLDTCRGLQMSKVICVNFFWTQILPCTYTDVIIVFLSCSNLWPTFVDPTCSKISWESWRKRKLRVCQPAADGTSWCGTAPLELLH